MTKIKKTLIRFENGVNIVFDGWLSDCQVINKGKLKSLKHLGKPFDYINAYAGDRVSCFVHGEWKNSKLTIYGK